jgi:hypothetical protein
MRHLSPVQHYLRLARLERLANGYLKRAIQKGTFAQARRAAMLVERVNSALTVSAPFEITPFKSCDMLGLPPARAAQYASSTVG